MSMNEWSEDIIIAKLADEPMFSEDLINLMKRLEETPPELLPDVIVDMQEVSFLNSSNIAQLLRLRQFLHRSRRRLRVCSVSDQVWSMLLMTGLDKIFNFNDNVATSLAALQIDPG